MKDIVDRLRSCGKYLLEHTPADLQPDENDPDPDNTIFDEAATEIGRLRSALRVNALRWGYSDKEIDKIISNEKE